FLEKLPFMNFEQPHRGKSTRKNAGTAEQDQDCLPPRVRYPRTNQDDHGAGKSRRKYGAVRFVGGAFEAVLRLDRLAVFSFIATGNNRDFRFAQDMREGGSFGR